MTLAPDPLDPAEGQAAERPVDPIARADRTGQAWEMYTTLLLVTGTPTPTTFQMDSGCVEMLLHPCVDLNRHPAGKVVVAEDPGKPWEETPMMARLL